MLKYIYKEKYGDGMLEIRVAVVDDEASNNELLIQFLENFREDKNVSFKVDAYKDGLDLISKYKSQYDIIFLDIEMKYLNGMDTATKIRKIDDHVLIIFVTNLAQFALKGYEVDADAFLVKPITYVNIVNTLKKCIDKLKRRKKNYIILNTDVGIRKILISDILYIESIKHNLIIHTIDQIYKMWGSMKDMETKFEPYAFSRCNVSYIVNLAMVKGIDQNNVLIENVALKISRNRKKTFMEDLTNYYREEA